MADGFKPALDAAHREALQFLGAARVAHAAATVDQAGARQRLVTELPEHGMADEAVIAELIEASRGGVVPTMGGRFFGFVVGGVHPAGVAADWLAAAWDDSPSRSILAPFSSAVDAVAGRWVLELLGLPAEASVGIVTGATVGNLVGICAARRGLLERVGWNVEAQGLYGAPEIRVMIGAEAHDTARLALRMAGFGAQRVIEVPTDDQGAMRADAFLSHLGEVEGPVLVMGQAGNVNTGASDPFDVIAAACEERGAWLHVDGAFGLWAQVSPALRAQTRGVERAHSWSVDAHKLLNTPYDGGLAIVRDRAAHAAAMAARVGVPHEHGEREPSHFVPEFSRRSRGLSIYATIRALGREGLRAAMERSCAHAGRLRDLLVAEPGIDCLHEVVLNQALFRFGNSDDRTDRVAERVRRSGEAWFHTVAYRGQRVMRCSVADHATRPEDIERAAAAVIAAHRALG